MVVESISCKGSGAVNEDIFGQSGSKFWVLDGATPVTEKRFFDANSDAAFLVRRFSEELETEPPYLLDNRDLMENAMKKVRDGLSVRPPNKPELMPSFAMAMADIQNDTICIDCLSDCYVIIWRSDVANAEIYTDTRIAVVSEKTQRVKDYVNKHKNDISPETGKEMIKNQIIENRKLMNKEGGFWVGTIDGGAFNNTVSWNVDKNSISEIIICSDGFFRLFQYGIMEIEDFFEKEVPLDEALRLLRNYEYAMADNEEYKRCDDATALKITLA